MTGPRTLAVVLALWLAPGWAFAGIDETWVKPGGGSWGADWFKPLFHGDEFGKSYAVVVGIGDYDSYPRLEAPAKDAARVRDFLIQDAGFDEVVTLTDDKATFARINELLEEIYPARLNGNDRFLFYFSGHGDTRDLYGGKRGYLVLDSAPRQGWSRMIDMPKVREWSANFGRARQSLFILDACFSGLVGFEPKGGEDDETLERLRQPAHQLITAGDEGEQSFAADGESLFTDAFLRAARGEGDLTGDGLVSLNELMVKVGKLIDQRRNELQDKIKMTPRAWLARTDNNSGEFFFIAEAKQEQAKATATAILEPKGPTLSPFDERALDLSFWESIRSSRKQLDFEAYLRSFPNGIYAALARSRLDDLGAAQSSSVQATSDTQTPAPAAQLDPQEASDALPAKPVEAARLQVQQNVPLLRTLAPSQDLAPPPAAEQELKLNLSREDWRGLQRALSVLGFDTGGADGWPGPITRRALTAWQKTKGVERTGYLGPEQDELILSEASPKLSLARDTASAGQVRQERVFVQLELHNQSNRRMVSFNIISKSKEKSIYQSHNAIPVGQSAKISFPVTQNECDSQIRVEIFLEASFKVGSQFLSNSEDINICKQKHYYFSGLWF